MRGSLWLVSLMMLGAFACADGGAVRNAQEGDLPGEQDVPSAPDVTEPQDSRADSAVQPDVAPPEDTRDHQEEGPLLATLTPSTEALSDARFYLELTDGKAGEVTVTVMAVGLGKIAGLAFTLTHDPARLKLAGAQNLVDLGKTTSVETRSIVRQIGSGTTAFGAARYCLAKMPWGDVDQCGGVAVDEATPIALFRYEMLAEGATGLYFEADSTLVRRPDRSSVRAQWINASLRIGRE